MPLKILLIEDNIGGTERLREMVSECERNYELHSADSLASGLKLLQKEPFDAVFLDLGLPDSSGLDTLRTLRDQQQATSVPVIVVAEQSDGEFAARAISLGAQDYVLKGRTESGILCRSILYSIERKRNEIALKERQEFSDALNRLNSLIHSTLDFETIMRRVITESAQVIGVEGAALGLFQNEYYVIKYVYNMAEWLDGRKFSPHEIKGILHSARKRDVVTFKDAFTDERLNQDITRKFGIRSLMVAPLVVQGRVLGAMSFFCLSGRCALNDLHEDFARKLSASIAIALENARLSETLRECEQLSRSRLSQLQAIYAAAPVGLCFTDTDLRFVNMNERFAGMNGVPVEQHIGRTIREVVPDLAQIVEPYYRLAIESGKPVENVEICCAAKSQSGDERCWFNNFYPVTDPGGRIIGVNVVVQEITAQKRMGKKGDTDCDEIPRVSLHAASMRNLKS